MADRDDQRRSRLAQALRDNLKRRKGADGPPASPPPPPRAPPEERD